MSISAGVSVTGTKEVLLALRQIDPEMRKQFDRDAKQIAAPIVEAAKQDYPEKYPRTSEEVGKILNPNCSALRRQDGVIRACQGT